MSQQVDTFIKTFTASGAIGANLRVKLNGSLQLTLAGLADKEIGTTEIACFNQGDKVPVRLRNAPGTRKVVAAGAGAANAPIFTAPNGQVSTTQATGSFVWGQYLLEAPGQAGDTVEALPNMHGDSAGP